MFEENNVSSPHIYMENSCANDGHGAYAGISQEGLMLIEAAGSFVACSFRKISIIAFNKESFNS